MCASVYACVFTFVCNSYLFQFPLSILVLYLLSLRRFFKGSFPRLFVLVNSLHPSLVTSSWAFFASLLQPTTASIGFSVSGILLTLLESDIALISILVAFSFCSLSRYSLLITRRFVFRARLLHVVTHITSITIQPTPLNGNLEGTFIWTSIWKGNLSISCLVVKSCITMPCPPLVQLLRLSYWCHFVFFLCGFHDPRSFFMLRSILIMRKWPISFHNRIQISSEFKYIAYGSIKESFADNDTKNEFNLVR